TDRRRTRLTTTTSPSPNATVPPPSSGRRSSASTGTDPDGRCGLRRAPTQANRWSGEPPLESSWRRAPSQQQNSCFVHAMSTRGFGFIGNADYLALRNLRHTAPDLTTGPTITTTTVLDGWERSRPVWPQVQDGAVPQAVSMMLNRLLPFRSVRAAWRRFRPRGPKQTFAFLSMGHDAGSGRLELDGSGEARLRWVNRWQSRLYRAEGRVGPAVARIIRAPVRAVATWSLFRLPVTVHPLGGVPTSSDPAKGV